MTNAAMNAMKTQFGDRMFAISLDNNRTVFVGYEGYYTIDDIEFTTLGTDEVVKIHNKMTYNGTELHYTTYHSSDNVQWIGFMSEESNMYRPNPIEFK